MNVSIFGSTGFVGSYILKAIKNCGYSAQVLIKSESEQKLSIDCDTILGDISDKDAISDTIEGTDAIIYNIGIIRQFESKNISFEALHYKGVKDCIEVASNLGVKRFILMSANGVKSNGTEYQTTKWKAEQILKKSDLNWTIFRPSLIFGDPRGFNRPEFCTQIRNDMLSLPIPAPLFFPGISFFNAGLFSLSPMHVSNVADFFVKSIVMESSYKKTFNLGGPDILSWKEIIHMIALVSNKLTWKIPAPVLPVKILASILEGFEWFPITKDQLTMLMEGNIVSEQYFNEFKINAIPFSIENLSYLKK